MKEEKINVEKNGGLNNSADMDEERRSNLRLHDDISSNILPRTPFLGSLRDKRSFISKLLYRFECRAPPIR